jgi:hypothetical protein
VLLPPSWTDALSPFDSWVLGLWGRCCPAVLPRVWCWWWQVQHRVCVCGDCTCSLWSVAVRRVSSHVRPSGMRNACMLHAVRCFQGSAAAPWQGGRHQFPAEFVHGCGAVREAGPREEGHQELHQQPVSGRHLEPRALGGPDHCQQEVPLPRLLPRRSGRCAGV